MVSERGKGNVSRFSIFSREGHPFSAFNALVAIALFTLIGVLFVCFKHALKPDDESACQHLPPSLQVDKVLKDRIKTFCSKERKKKNAEIDQHQ